MMRPCLPPLIVAVWFEVGNETTAWPERKATYLDLGSTKLARLESWRDVLYRGRVMSTSIELGRQYGEGHIGGIAQLLGCRTCCASLIGNGKWRTKLPTFERRGIVCGGDCSEVEKGGAAKSNNSYLQDEE